MAIHKDEIELARLALAVHGKSKLIGDKWWTHESGIATGRIKEIMEEWKRKELFDYDVTFRSGWLTDKGLAFWHNFIADMDQDIA